MIETIPELVAQNSSHLQPGLERAVQQAQWIEPQANLESLVDSLRSCPALALDTEFVRERTYYPRPGLVQISDGRSAWLIDPINRNRWSGLEELISSADVNKVLHAAGEDLEVLNLLTGRLPDPLFDTQIAAAMLGFPLQVRYETLVGQCFNTTLPSGQARSDWCRRPLSEALLNYAARDVLWLPHLAEFLGEHLARRDRLAWLQEDCARLLRRAREPNQRPAVARVKGAGRLNRVELGWLNDLVCWRDEQARTRDLPRSFVLRDDDLTRIATEAAAGRDPHTILAGLSIKKLGRMHRELTALLAVEPPAPIDPPVELTPLSEQQHRQLKNAQSQVRDIAAALQVDPALIASKRELMRLLRGEPVDWIDGWRGDLIGHLKDP